MALAVNIMDSCNLRIKAHCEHPSKKEDKGDTVLAIHFDTKMYFNIKSIIR